MKKKSTKETKFRHVYTVIREYDTDNINGEKDFFSAVLDETGEYLYGGSAIRESISVKMQVMNKKGEWEDFRESK